MPPKKTMGIRRPAYWIDYLHKKISTPLDNLSQNAVKNLTFSENVQEMSHVVFSFIFS